MLAEPELSWSGHEVCLSCGYQGTVPEPLLFVFAVVAEDSCLLLSCFIAFDLWTSSSYSFTHLSTLTTPGCLGKICMHRPSARDFGWKRRCGSISVLLLPCLIFRKSLLLTPFFFSFLLFFFTPFSVTLEHENSRYFFPSGPTNENRTYDDVLLITKSSQYN